MGEPVPAMRSWQINGDQAVPLGPWETPGPDPVDPTLDEMAAAVDQLGETGLQDGPGLMDPEAMFGSPDPEGAGDSVSAAPTSKGGSTGSSPLAGLDPKAQRLRAKAFGQLAGAAFAMLSGLLNARLRLDEEDPTWLADAEDLAAVGDPAGRIIARHAPLPDGTDAGDLADGIGIAIAAAGYLIKNSRARAAAISARRRVQVPAEG